MSPGERIVIIAPVYPISQKKIIATWAHQQAKAIKEIGYSVEVISPTPYIPNFLAQTGRLSKLADLPKTQIIDGITIHYPRSAVYRHKVLSDYLYKRFPRIENISSYIPIRNYIRNIIQRENVCGLICHNPVPAGFIGSRIKDEIDGPMLTLFHSATELDQSAQNERLHTIFESVFAQSDQIVTVSTPMVKRFQEYYGISPHVIRNGFDSKEVECAQDWRKESSKAMVERRKESSAMVEILSVGSLIERKGHHYLIKSLANLLENGPNIESDFICNIVGTGPEKDALKKLASELGLAQKVNFKQNLSREELNRLMSSSDLFVLPSWDEPCAVVYTEVMPHSTPIIMCKGQGLSKIVAKNGLGITVSSRNASELADAISTLLVNENLRKELGANARSYAYKNLTWEDNARELTSLISNA